MNNINRQINRTVDYLIDVEVDGVHVCNDTTADDVYEVRDGVSENFVEGTKKKFLTCFLRKDNDRMGNGKHFRISHLVLCT